MAVLATQLSENKCRGPAAAWISSWITERTAFATRRQTVFQ